jgi:hypothetical protein
MRLSVATAEDSLVFLVKLMTHWYKSALICSKALSTLPLETS